MSFVIIQLGSNPFTKTFENDKNTFTQLLSILPTIKVLSLYIYIYIYRIQPIPYWYDLKYPPALSSFLPCQEVSRKFLASTGCFSLFRMSCTVCCNPIQDFAFGSCDHKDLCANCMLHWLMLYKETTCPTCRVTLLPQYYD